MQSLAQLIKVVRLRRVATRTAFEIVAETILGGVCGALFGLVFGCLGRMLHHDPWRVVATVAYFGVCAMLAVSVMGIAGRILESESGRLTFHKTLHRVHGGSSKPVQTPAESSEEMIPGSAAEEGARPAVLAQRFRSEVARMRPHLIIGSHIQRFAEHR